MSIRPCNPRARPRARNASSALALATLVLVLGASTAHALSTDREQAMDINANHQKTQLGTKSNAPDVTHLNGNVQMAQGSLKARADAATVYQHAGNAKDAQGNDVSGGVQRIVLVGKRAHLQQLQDNDAGLMTADADKIDYNADTGIAELSGNVSVVQQGRGEFHGAHMTYNTNTGEMESGDNSSASRVHMVIQPKAKPAPAKPPAPTDAKAAPAPPPKHGSDTH